ncbi:MAG: hypothetical protein Q7U77_13635 [Sediminibacterium sp.]|uniref:hypothetical protein n=1 Tax=Sediminibacterium sp. TaxID=1917865 RepID=UPI002717551A|nr:hypothetical protein [Sediminibacterium sp.]MDO8997661.1 hypothetical protein [Sediminibacterium sp.]
MKKILFLFIFLFSFVSPGIASEIKSESVDNEFLLCDQFNQSNENVEKIAARGCCSHHGGVCGCNGGRVTCCDNSTSPSCTCNKEEPFVIPN